MRAGVLLLLLAASCSSAGTPPSNPPAAAPEEPVVAVVPSALPEAPPLWTPSPGPGSGPRVEGRLGHPVCVGPPISKSPPQKATCCYPVMDLLKKPIRDAYPALGACYEGRRNRTAEGRVVFAFRIEQDGSVQRVCASEDSTMDDEPAAACMVEVIRKLRWPADTTEGVDLCGLISLSYPVVFGP